MEYLEKALSLKTELDRLLRVYKSPESLTIETSGSEWMYHVNSLEGTSFSFKTSKEWLLWGFRSLKIPVASQTLPDDFFQWIFHVLKEDDSITEDLIKKLHTFIIEYPDTKGAPPKTKKDIPGTYKSQSNNVILPSGMVLKFATPEETSPLMYDLISWYQDKKISYHINGILLATEFHYKLIHIHPFEDGNIRVARLVMNLILLKFNFPPIALENEQDDYFAALQKANLGNKDALIECTSQNLVNSMERMISEILPSPK